MIHIIFAQQTGKGVLVMAAKFDEEFKFYLENQDSFVKEHDGEYVVIKGGSVLGFYEDQIRAIEETQKKHELGTFMIQRISEGDADYTRTFHSRVGLN